MSSRSCSFKLFTKYCDPLNPISSAPQKAKIILRDHVRPHDEQY